ncbi:MAG: DUF1549 domain-containing protein, partial [Verrucomicrobiales bacterium]
MMQEPYRTFLATVFAGLSSLSLLAQASVAVDFETEILPIFEDRCLDCHGPDKQKSELRVDRRATLLRGGDSGLASLVPGDPEKSYLIELIKGLDPDSIMPEKGDPLSADEIALLEKWIAEGAPWPGQMDTVAEIPGADHWALQPVERPAAAKQRGDETPVDAYLREKLDAAGLSFNPPAAPRQLIRRASILLTGLPPTPDRVAAFERACEQNSAAAYAALVDELLASPHFGERWAQHWLDVIRWAETNGSEANLYRKGAWIYRDYVVRSFNDDIPYDRFVTEQLAGDRSGAGEATGFLVAGPHVPAATVGQEPSAIRQARADRIDEIMQTVGASMLGMTVGCARCHNHKFDPISIVDYYAMSAVFQGVEFGGRVPEFAEAHPRKKRARELNVQTARERRTLRAGAAVWEEDWGGYQDLQFPATTTTALRIEFDRAFISIDELQVYGPGQQNRNLALASSGVTLVADESMTDPRGRLENANDGDFGTQSWKSRAPKDSKEKPWVEILFPEAREVNRFRFSNNREIFFDTDYLEQKGAYRFPGYRISARLPDGSWKEIGSTEAARRALAGNP